MASPHHSVYPPAPLFCWGEEVEPPTKFLKRGALTGPQLLEGGWWERGGDFLKKGGGGGGGGSQFLHKR